jgi:hypothetical protein
MKEFGIKAELSLQAADTPHCDFAWLSAGHNLRTPAYAQNKAPMRSGRFAIPSDFSLQPIKRAKRMRLTLLFLCPGGSTTDRRSDLFHPGCVEYFASFMRPHQKSLGRISPWLLFVNLVSRRLDLHLASWLASIPGDKQGACYPTLASYPLTYHF